MTTNFPKEVPCVYTTSDNQLFTNLKEAEKHQHYLDHDRPLEKALMA